MKVLKFGGTSVGTPENIQAIISILKQGYDNDTAVIVSAFGGTTDQIIDLAELAANKDDQWKASLKELLQRHQQAIDVLVKEGREEVSGTISGLFEELEQILQGVSMVRELSPKSLDVISGFGERLSSVIITAAFNDAGLKALLADSANLVKTNTDFGNARVNTKETYKNINGVDRGGAIWVVPGFIGTSDTGERTTIGRGGSDYTAAIFAAALNAEALEIWTDVDGVLTANPRKVNKAFPIDRLSYDEAMELSYFGAKVIYPPTIQPALANRIPIVIKNTFNPRAEGTAITAEAGETDQPVKGITSIDRISLLTISGSGMIGIPGTSMRLFGALGQHKISVILISQASSEHTITFAVKSTQRDAARAAIEEAFELELAAGKIDPIAVEDDLCIMAIVGQNMSNTPGISGKLFSTLGSNGVNVSAIAQGASELNISFVIRSKDETKALNLLHESFFLSENKTVHLFVAGVGLVGGTLFEQIAKQRQFLLDEFKIDLKLAALSNSRQMVFDEEGIDPNNWKAALENNSEAANPVDFANRIIQQNKRNSIFVDCTAHEPVAEVYEMLLDKSVSVVAANKIASSASYERYLGLKKLAAKRGVKYLFETNVGAGLPVLNTLADLVHSGDKVLKIEAVLSGTMNFICNNISADTSFSDAVKAAKEAGFTEPDPRVDLSGLDVARKILILAREAGYQLEADQVEIQPFLPDNVFEADDMDGFWKALEDNDASFEITRCAIEQKGTQLRPVAGFNGASAYVGLKDFAADHPFYSLAGSDAIVLFYTTRYTEPLVVKGAGAGAAVTAAGVFADIMRIVS